jgi:hypothetical protein
MSQTRRDTEQLWQFVNTVASMLEETRQHAKVQIYQIVRIAGTEKTIALLKDVLAIEEAGGMLTNKQERRRTPGGVFFVLARQKGYLPELSAEERKARWQKKRARMKAKKRQAREQLVTPSLPERKTA